MASKFDQSFIEIRVYYPVQKDKQELRRVRRLLKELVQGTDESKKGAQYGK